MTDATAEVHTGHKVHTLLPNGKRIHFRRTQTFYWKIIVGLVGAGIIAGLYFDVLQVNWHLFTLKAWWDHLLPYEWWPVYRHTAFRDLAEPAIATMFVMTLMAKPYTGKPIKTLRLATAPFLLLLMTFMLTIGGTWFLNYAFGHPILTTGKIGNLLVGAVIGMILHRFWAPIGATLRSAPLEDAADKAARTKKIPFWVRYPLLPPVVREQFADMYRASRKVDYDLYSQDHTTTRRVLIITAVVLGVLLAASGFIGHFWVGTLGHTIGWFQPVNVN